MNTQSDLEYKQMLEREQAVVNRVNALFGKTEPIKTEAASTAIRHENKTKAAIYFTRNHKYLGDWQYTKGTKLGGLKQVASRRNHDQIGQLMGDRVVVILTCHLIAPIKIEWCPLTNATNKTGDKT
jgi:hypothetical protein